MTIGKQSSLSELTEHRLYTVDEVNSTLSGDINSEEILMFGKSHYNSKRESKDNILVIKNDHSRGLNATSKYKSTTEVVSSNKDDVFLAMMDDNPYQGKRLNNFRGTK